jgi:hypothetical protein
MKRLFAITTVSVLFFSAANAQIVYTDINPDSRIVAPYIINGTNSAHYNLDLDNDGTVDFTFSVYFSRNSRSGETSYFVRIGSGSGNQVANNNSYVSALDSLAVIDSSLQKWSGNASLTLAQGSKGNWENGDTAYVPLKLSKGGNVYYGWIRLCNVIAGPFGAGMTAMDYAYNSVPDHPILAGQKNIFNWVGVTAITKNPYCSGSNIKITYSTSGSFNPSNIFTAQLSDINGSFTNPVIIGSKKSAAAGTINAIIPSGTTTGSKYRIRVIASTKVDAVVDNGSNIIIQQGAPNAAISAEGPTSFCAGNNVVLSTPSSPGYNYQWMNSKGSVLSSVDSVWLDSSGKYDCVISNACGVDTSNKIMVTANNVPVAKFTPASGTIDVCNGDSLTFHANKGTWFTYQWYKDNVAIPGAVSSSLTIDTSGAYSVIETSTKGCSNTSYIQSVEFLVPPIITVQVVFGDSSICAGDSAELYAQSLWGGPSTYQWKQNGVNISGATSEAYFAKAAGVYKCEAFALCGTAISRGITITEPCRANAAFKNEEKIISTKDDQLKIAPNPFSNSTTISFSISQSQKISVCIFDLTGRLVKTIASAQMQAGIHQITWNAKDENGNAVNGGVYFLRIQAGDYSETRKLIVEK